MLSYQKCGVKTGHVPFYCWCPDECVLHKNSAMQYIHGGPKK